MVQLGVGLDSTLDLSIEAQARLAEAAGRLGYTSIWTPSSLSYEPLQPISDSFAWTGYYHMAVFS